MPPEAFRTFQEHRSNCRRRGIAFAFTPKAWWAWWQIDDRWSYRGVGMGKFMMARRGHVGPYTPENVRCVSHGRNMTDMTPEAQSRSEVHPRSRPVGTPVCPYGSATLAAACGVPPRTAARWARQQDHGWRCEQGSGAEVSHSAASRARGAAWSGGAHSR